MVSVFAGARPCDRCLGAVERCGADNVWLKLGGGNILKHANLGSVIVGGNNIAFAMDACSSPVA
jgi:hypothetical protein